MEQARSNLYYKNGVSCRLKEYKPNTNDRSKDSEFCIGGVIKEFSGKVILTFLSADGGIKQFRRCIFLSGLGAT